MFDEWILLVTVTASDQQETAGHKQTLLEIKVTNGYN